MSKRFPTPEEEAEERAQGEALLRAIQEIREREARQREALRQAVDAGYGRKAEDERRQRDEGGG